MVDTNNLPKGLQGKSTGELRQILIEALRRYSLPASWGSIDGKDIKNVRNPIALLERIDELCNEFYLNVHDSGALLPLDGTHRKLNIAKTFVLYLDSTDREQPSRPLAVGSDMKKLKELAATEVNAKEREMEMDWGIGDSGEVECTVQDTYTFRLVSVPVIS